MKFTLPVHDEPQARKGHVNELDRTETDLYENDIQRLLDAIVVAVECTHDLDDLRELAVALNIVDVDLAHKRTTRPEDGIKMVIACRDASGKPDHAFVIVKCSTEDYELGKHYDLAEDWARDDNYEAPFVCFDEVEAPDWLLEKFVWETATVVG